jgi:hypothetical protein
VLWKRVSVLLAAAMIVLSMFAASAPAFAQGASCDPQPGNVEMSRDPIGAPPQEKPGTSQRTTTADEKDPSGIETGRGERCV